MPLKYESNRVYAIFWDLNFISLKTSQTQSSPEYANLNSRCQHMLPVRIEAIVFTILNSLVRIK